MTSSGQGGRLRILQVVHGFPPYDVAGAEVYTENLCHELASRHNVGVFYRRKDPSRPSYTLTRSSTDGILLYELVRNIEEDDVAADYRLFPLSYWDPSVDRPFLGVLAEFRPDVVHFQHVIRLSASLVPLVHRLRIPSVVTLHDYWFVCPRISLLKIGDSLCEGPREGLACPDCMIPYLGPRALHSLTPLAKLALLPLGAVLSSWPSRIGPSANPLLALLIRPKIMRWVFGTSALAISPSHFLKHTLVANGFPADNIRVIPNGIDRRPFRNLIRPPSPLLRVGYLGGLTRKKGLHVLLRAFSRLHGVNAELSVYADLQDETPYHRELAEMAKMPNVRFVGRFDHHRIGEVLGSLDVIAVPSLCYENDPLVVQEAYLAGLPVVASSLGALEEKVLNARTGLTFVPGDDADLAQKLRRLAVEPGLLSRLASDLPRPPTVGENARCIEEVYRIVGEAGTQRVS